MLQLLPLVIWWGFHELVVNSPAAFFFFKVKKPACYHAGLHFGVYVAFEQDRIDSGKNTLLKRGALLGKVCPLAVRGVWGTLFTLAAEQAD